MVTAVRNVICRLTHELIKAYGLNQHMTMHSCGQQWVPLTAQEANVFHTDAFVHFLQQLDFNAADVLDDAPSFVLNPSVCFSESTWSPLLALNAHLPCPTEHHCILLTREYSTIYAGASVAAAKSLTQGASDIAINWMGGQAHARRDCASGFSYLNDVVLAILTLLKVNERVMFVGLDAWHPSGVEEAFYTTVSHPVAFSVPLCLFVLLSISCSAPGNITG